MANELPPALRAFTPECFVHDGIPRPFYWYGEGKPVIVLHELFGLTEEVARFGCRLAKRAGVRVYLPVLFGQPQTSGSLAGRAVAIAQMCLSREFSLFAAHRASPVVDALRTLADLALVRHGAERFGMIGLCLTGNFALAMMCDTRLTAPVLSEPSLPFAFTAAGKAQLGVDDPAIACARQRTADQLARDGGPALLGFRFRPDAISPVQRFDNLKRLLGDGFERHDLEPPSRKPKAHSVFGVDYDDTAGSETRRAFDRLVQFLGQRL
jgi:dienelactone hydrolase